MKTAIRQFVAAHELYQHLDQVRTRAPLATAARADAHCLLRAYLEVQRRARVIAGLQSAGGFRFAEMH